MQTTSPTTGKGTGYAGQEVTKPPPWHGLVVWDVTCNSLTTGLYLVAALCQLLRPDVFSDLVKVAYPVALVLLLADLLLLVLDLGDPCASITCCACSSSARPCRWEFGA